MMKIIGNVALFSPLADPDDYPEEISINGFFVNSTKRLDGLDEYLAQDESYIPKIFGATTYHYQFSSDEQARAVLGYWYPSEENEPFQAAYRKADKRRKERIEEIKAQAELLYVQDVTDADGNVWKGGTESGRLIKDGIDLAELGGATSFIITDANRDEHLFSMSEAKAVVALIGADYQRKFLARQAACRALEQIDCFAADALQQIEAIKLEV